jgi:hypothetical protein
MDKSANESTKDKFSFGITTLLKFSSSLEQVDRLQKIFEGACHNRNINLPQLMGSQLHIFYLKIGRKSSNHG